MNCTKTISAVVILFLLTGIRAVYGVVDAVCTSVQTIDTSQFIPPSPDPSGLEYLDSSDTLMIADGEVEETMQGITFYQGANMWEMTPQGVVVDTWETTSHPPNPPSFSDEAVGVAYNPANKHLFISDDNKDDVYEVNPGGDQIYGTADDVVTSFDTRAFGSQDPEGIAYGDGVLFIADGFNKEIYKVTPGGTMTGQFDTESFGMTDPEGIGFSPDSIFSTSLVAARTIPCSR